MSEEGFRPETPGLVDGAGLSIAEGQAEMLRRREVAELQRQKEKAALKMDILVPMITTLAFALGMKAFDIGPKIPSETKPGLPAASTLFTEDIEVRTLGKDEITLEQYEKLNDVLEQTTGLLEPVLHWFPPQDKHNEDI